MRGTDVHCLKKNSAKPSADARHGFLEQRSKKVQYNRGGLVFFSFWVLLGSSGVPSGVLLVFFWCSSGFFWVLLIWVFLRVVPLSRCAVVRERGLSSGSAGLASGGYLGTRMLSSPCAGAWVA